MKEERGRRDALYATAAVTAASVVVSMPALLVGASSVLLRSELGFSEAGLGMAISIFFAAAAMSSGFAGRWAERLGASRALALSCSGSAFVLFGIGFVAEEFVHLGLLLALGGMLNGLAQPATNLALSRNTTFRPGFMFGIKQSGIPLASLLAGGSVPLVGVRFGWRAAFLIGALLAGCVALFFVTRTRQRSRTEGPSIDGRDVDASLGPLVLLALGAGIASGTALTLPSFIVESGLRRGLSSANAGWLLVGASTAGIASRLLAGWVADHQRGRILYMVAGMLVVGAGGFAMLAFGGRAIFLLGAGVAYAFGWGWSGLLMLSVVRLSPNAPAAASGVVIVGAAGGGAAGPFAFGLVVTKLGFDTAWALAGIAALAAAVVVLVARSRLVHDRRGEADTP